MEFKMLSSAILSIYSVSMYKVVAVRRYKKKNNNNRIKIIIIFFNIKLIITSSAKIQQSIKCKDLQ